MSSQSPHDPPPSWADPTSASGVNMSDPGVVAAVLDGQLADMGAERKLRKLIAEVLHAHGAMGGTLPDPKRAPFRGWDRAGAAGIPWGAVVSTDKGTDVSPTVVPASGSKMFGTGGDPFGGVMSSFMRYGGPRYAVDYEDGRREPTITPLHGNGLPEALAYVLHHGMHSAKAREAYGKEQGDPWLNWPAKGPLSAEREANRARKNRKGKK